MTVADLRRLDPIKPSLKNSGSAVFNLNLAAAVCRYSSQCAERPIRAVRCDDSVCDIRDANALQYDVTVAHQTCRCNLSRHWNSHPVEQLCAGEIVGRGHF